MSVKTEDLVATLVPPTHPRPSIRWVRQWHASGCGVAVLAMLTGRPYGEIVKRIAGHDGSGHDGDWNAHGVTHLTLDRVLAEEGFWLQRHYAAWHADYEEPVTDPAPVRRAVPKPGHTWPPEPWAPVHYASVQQPSGHGHFVVMLADGRVLDPLREGFYSLSDWPAVNQVTGLRRP